MDPSTHLFQQHRSRLFGLAYRMLGTPADAEDVLQDAWLRLQGFAEDAIHISDGGGVARATLRPLHGADRLARLYVQLGRNLRGSRVRYEAGALNGVPAVFMFDGDTLFAAMWIESDGERITAIHALRHPGKLARLASRNRRAPRPCTEPADRGRHGKETPHDRAAGETEQRLHLLPAWRETTLYSERERIALAWAEELTELASHDAVSDALYAKAREHSRRPNSST